MSGTTASMILRSGPVFGNAVLLHPFAPGTGRGVVPDRFLDLLRRRPAEDVQLEEMPEGADDVGVAVDEPRQDELALQVDDLCRLTDEGGGAGVAPDIDESPVLDGRGLGPARRGVDGVKDAVFQDKVGGNRGRAGRAVHGQNQASGDQGDQKKGGRTATG